MLEKLELIRERLVGRIPQLRPGHPSYPWWVLAAIGFASVMSILDTTIVNVAIAKLEVAFGASTDAVQWVITGYLLAFAIMLAASGWLADRFGYKTIFLISIALFTTGSFLCSISWSLGSLVLFRIIQGIGGGTMGPVTMAYLRREFPQEKLGMAMGIFSIPMLAFSSFGPTLGGWIIDNFAWQLIFMINVPIGIAGLGVSYLILREYPAKESAAFDFPGFAAIAISLGALLLALSDGNADWNTDGWTSAFVMGCFGVAAAGFLLFFIIEFTADHPLIDFSLFKNFNFSLGSFVLFIFGLGIFGGDFLLPLYLQIGLGYSPMQAGLIFIPYGLGMIGASVIGGRLTDRIGAKTPGIFGILLRAYGMYRFVFLSPYSSSTQIISTILILAAGMGFLMSPIQTTVFASVPVKQAAQAGGLMQVIRQLGGSFGVAILSTILTHREKFHLVMLGQQMSSSNTAYQNVLAQLSSELIHRIGESATAAMSGAGAAIASEVQNHAFVSAIDDTFFVAMLVSVVSSIPFLFLKSKARKKSSEKAPMRPVPVEV